MQDAASAAAFRFYAVMISGAVHANDAKTTLEYRSAEMLLGSTFFLLLLGLLLLLACSFCLRFLYRREVRLFQQDLGHTYAARFDQKAIVARSSDENVATMLHLSKSVVDQVRDSSSDVPRTQAALNQVAEWLKGAAEESDRALKALESIPPKKGR